MMTMWYFYCRRTGHGDLDAARGLARRYLENADTLGAPEATTHIGMFHDLEGNPAPALKLAEKELAERGDPCCGLSVALLADERKDPKTRDAALKEARTRGSQYVSVVTHQKRTELAGLAAMIADDLAAGAKGRIDLAAAAQLCAKATPNDQQFFLWFLGKYLDLHGKPKEAEKCWKQCLAIMEDANLLAKTSAGAALVAHGLKADDFYKEVFREKNAAGQGKDAAEKPR